MKELANLILLIAGSVSDWKKKSIPLCLPAAGGATALLLRIWQIKTDGIQTVAAEFFPALLPGAFLLLLSFLTREKIGKGDGWMLMLCGALEGLETTLLLLAWGLFLQSILAVIFVICKKADRQTQIPFLPFLLAARLLLFIC